MATKVAGELYESITGQLFEIGRQLRQRNGYPFDPEKLSEFLQRAVEGRFDDNQCWREENGVIYFTVASDGTTGPDWIERLEKKGFRFSKRAKDVLHSPDFKPTNGVSYRIAVLKGKLFTDRDRITENIRAEVERRKLEKPNAEAACLIRDMFSDKELEAMGLWWIVVFHEPIKDSDGDPYLLSVDRGIGGSSLLGVCRVGPVERWYSWDSGDGLVFALPQVPSN